MKSLSEIISGLDGRLLGIFGAGNMGKFILNTCLEKNVHVAFFCDNATGGRGESFKNVPIMSWQEVKERFGQVEFLVATGDFDAVCAQTEKTGCKLHPVTEFLPCEAFAKVPVPQRFRMEANWYSQKHYFEKHEKIALDSLDLMLTERCSLRCRECSNLMQYYIKPQNFSFEELKDEMDRMLLLCDEIYEVRLLGGEPFMNREIGRVIEYLTTQPQVKCICIYTNGTIVPDEVCLEAMRSSGRTWLSISDYNELSCNLESLKRSLEVYDIPYEVKSIDYWTRCSSFTKHGRSMESLEKVFSECCARHLFTLLKGKLYVCPFIANGVNLHALPDLQEDYVDIMKYGVEETKIKLRQCFIGRKYFHLCDYCNGRPYFCLAAGEKIAPHEQISNPKTYKKVY